MPNYAVFNIDSQVILKALNTPPIYTKMALGGILITVIKKNSATIKAIFGINWLRVGALKMLHNSTRKRHSFTLTYGDSLNCAI